MSVAAREFRLSPAGSGRGLSCDADGAFIDSIPLLARVRVGGRELWEARDSDELSQDLTSRFGLPIDIAAKDSGLKAIAKALSAGNVVHAQLVALHLQFPQPPEVTKAAEAGGDLLKFILELHASGLIKADWNPDLHPRWPAGAPDSQGGQFAPKGGPAAGIGHNKGPALDPEPEAEAAESAGEVEGESVLAEIGAAAALAVPILLATTGSLNEGEDQEVADFHWHHSWPKYLGGTQDQSLSKLPAKLHIQYHAELQRIAPHRLGTQHYENLSPAKRIELLRKVAEMTKKFDSEHGTNLYQDMLRNGFPVNP